MNVEYYLWRYNLDYMDYVALPQLLLHELVSRLRLKLPGFIVNCNVSEFVFVMYYR